MYVVTIIPRFICGADYFTMLAHAPPVCARLCFLHPAQEPGNEADMDHDQLTDLFPYHAGPV